MYNIEFPRSESLSLKQEDLNALEIIEKKDNHWVAQLNNKIYRIEFENIDPDLKTFSVLINGERVKLKIKNDLDILIEDMGLNKTAEDNQSQVLAPMPGLVVDIKVDAGQELESGDALIVLEAMKMENIIKTKGKGEVDEVHVSIGDTVDKGQLLISFI